LPDAIVRARMGNLEARAAEVAEREARERTTQARAGYFPKVDVSETWQRGNQPVFVFSSLLSQRRFTTDAFAIDALNHPPATDNFRTGLTIEQPLFSAVTPIHVRMARLGGEAAAASRMLVHQDLAVAVTDAYGQVLVASAAKLAAAAAIEAAEASRVLATNRRDAGFATDADVLLVDVHLARARQRQIQSKADEQIARARLNNLMGEPLDAVFVLNPPGDAASQIAADAMQLERAALQGRPEIRLASLSEQVARATRDAARAAFLPEVVAQAGWETNGGAWTGRTASWLVGAVARVNLFRGFADRARLAEAREAVTRRAIDRETAETKVRLDVRTALAQLDAARASLAVGRSTVAEARESYRIINDRYEGGLADIVSLLRAAEAVQQADERHVQTEVSVMVATARLDRALGR
jgi:outer membrane protein TolC